MTQKQKQHLLAYLGFYSGAVDGIWGAASRQAALGFQRQWQLAEDAGFGPDSQRKIREVIAAEKEENRWQEIRWFDREEFRCRCGGKYCDGFPAEPEWALVELAEQVREHFCRPVLVSSGLRCKKHNDACGGVSNSRHLSGKAMDFRVESVPGQRVLAWVKALPGVRYAYAIDGSYIHMDIA